jgi:uncharacterized membrane protein YhaH (DUF805 family)
MDAETVVAVFFALAFLAFWSWVLARVFSKAGYSPWWGLLGLIPGLGALACILMLAFGDWPVLRD